MELHYFFGGRSESWAEIEGVISRSGKPYAHVVLTSYETFRSRVGRFNQTSQVNYKLFGRVFCDEAHALRSTSRDDFKIIKDIVFRTQLNSIFLLMATPMVNKFADLSTLLQMFQGEGWESPECRELSHELQRENLHLVQRPTSGWEDLTVESDVEILKDEDEAVREAKEARNRENRSQRIKNAARKEFF